uniref:EF-hand domain-containing protein n=1 Tax=Oryza punctata TaxID=4537 RepID=A0A0E0LTF9_ORYPU
MSGSAHPLDALLAAARAALAHLHLPFPGSNIPKHRQPVFDCHVLVANVLHNPILTSFPTCFRRTQHPKHPPPPLPPALHHLLDDHLQPHLHQFHTLLIHANKPHFDAFLSNLPFAKLKVGPPPPPASVSGDHQPAAATQTGDKEETDTAANDSPRTLPVRLLNIPFSNVDRLRSTLSTVSLTELIELVPHLVGRSLPSPDTHPDKKNLFSVHDFFTYAEFEGKWFFEELDRDRDGQVILEDLEVAMRKWRLPRRNIWFEAATLVAVPPPVEISTGSVLKSALAGGLASALSTSAMHPIGSMKRHVSKHLRFHFHKSGPEDFIGVLSPQFLVQSLSSFCSTILGTAVRIPCEVLKQRLQAGIFNNLGEAIVGTMQKDGAKGFFSGTGATLCREVPFYVAGMCLYAEAKKDVLEQKTGAVQNCPTDKAAPEPSPWSPVKRKAQDAGPFDCTKYSKTVRTRTEIPLDSNQIVGLGVVARSEHNTKPCLQQVLLLFHVIG